MRNLGVWSEVGPWLKICHQEAQQASFKKFSSKFSNRVEFVWPMAVKTAVREFNFLHCSKVHLQTKSGIKTNTFNLEAGLNQSLFFFLCRKSVPVCLISKFKNQKLKQKKILYEKKLKISTPKKPTNLGIIC
jgi:hypothetical protein